MPASGIAVGERLLRRLPARVAGEVGLVGQELLDALAQLPGDAGERQPVARVAGRAADRPAHRRAAGDGAATPRHQFARSLRAQGTWLAAVRSLASGSARCRSARAARDASLGVRSHQSSSRISPTSASSTRERATSASTAAATNAVPSSSSSSASASTLGQDLGVARLGGQQLGVGALGDDPAALDHRHPVGQADGRQAVGDDQGGAVGHEPAQRLVDLLLDLHVDGRGGVVEHEDRRVHEQRAGDGDALALPAGEGVAPLADHGVVALGQLAARSSSAPAARAAASISSSVGVGTAVGDVVADRHREEERLVEHHADVVAQARQREVAHVVAVDRAPRRR